LSRIEWELLGVSVSERELVRVSRSEQERAVMCGS
jgi:hypothetical protein